MKKVFAMLGLALIAGLLLLLCREDRVAVEYPQKIVSGVWSSSEDASMACDVFFAVNAACPDDSYCLITLSGYEDTQTGVFAGDLSYDPAVGEVVVAVEVPEDGPAQANLQFDAASNDLTVSFTSASKDYATFRIAKSTYPRSIAGKWNNGPIDGYQLVVVLGVGSAGRRLPCTIYNITPDNTAKLSGTYTYDSASGEGAAVVADADGSYKCVLSYDPVDGRMNLRMAGIGFNDKVARVRPGK